MFHSRRQEPLECSFNRVDSHKAPLIVILAVSSSGPDNCLDSLQISFFSQRRSFYFFFLTSPVSCLAEVSVNVLFLFSSTRRLFKRRSSYIKTGTAFALTRSRPTNHEVICGKWTLNLKVIEKYTLPTAAICLLIWYL